MIPLEMESYGFRKDLPQPQSIRCAIGKISHRQSARLGCEGWKYVKFVKVGRL